MVRAPATRDQVDAYRFGLRRLEAALVRGDPVPLHEQIRSQRRAAMAGALLGMLALGGVAIVALVSPSPQWSRQAIVVGRESGAMYAVGHDPDRLVPVANLAAGRLVLAALRRGGATGDDPATAVPVVVPDATLGDAQRTAAAAVPGAESVRPDGPGVAPSWAVCDETGGDGGGPVATTVVAGAARPPPGSSSGSSPGPPQADGVLLVVPGGRTWLVTGGRRHEIDLADRPLVTAFGIADRTPRPANPDLVSAVPAGPTLATPFVPGRGGPAPAGVPGRVGDVLVRSSSGGPEQYYVVLAAGLQKLPPLVADVLRAAGGVSRPVGPEVLAVARSVDGLDVTRWPVSSPRILDPAEAPFVCWTWVADGRPETGVLLGTSLPVPAGGVTVALAQADGAGARADNVVLADGGGGPVRATGPGRAPGAGPLWLVSATGVTHGVADADSAEALGITRAQPAPEAALRMLPRGTLLDLAQAARMVDVMPTGS